EQTNRKELSTCGCITSSTAFTTGKFTPHTRITKASAASLRQDLPRASDIHGYRFSQKPYIYLQAGTISEQPPPHSDQFLRTSHALGHARRRDQETLLFDRRSQRNDRSRTARPSVLGIGVRPA